MGLILDTNTYTALDRHEPTIKQKVIEADQIVLPIVVVGELLFGYSKGKYTAANQARLAKFIDSPRVTVVPVTWATAEHYAGLKLSQQQLGKSLADNDLWIAATCLQLELPLLTLDSDFDLIVDKAFKLIQT